MGGGVPLHQADGTVVKILCTFISMTKDWMVRPELCQNKKKVKKGDHICRNEMKSLVVQYTSLRRVTTLVNATL